MSTTSPAAPVLPGEQVPFRPARVHPCIAEAWKNGAGYMAAAVVSAAAVVAVLHLWRADLRVPLWYSGDNLMSQLFVQNVQDSGWVFDNDRLGAPHAMDLRDYPIPDVLHIASLKILGFVFPNSAVVLNLFYLIAFPLTALSAYFVLRRMRLGRLAALVPAVLYTATPYHFLRLHGHLFLSAYYLIPPMLWLILRVYLGRNPFLRPLAQSGSPEQSRWRLWSWEAAGAALVCILTGLAGVYYAFFSCFLMLAAGAAAASRERRWATLAASVAPVVLIAGALAAALAPSFLHMAQQGRNLETTKRLPAEADQCGLRVSEMLLPIYQHRIGFLARLQERFFAPPRQATLEAWAVPLGALASLGFVLLVGRFFWRRRDGAVRLDDGLAFLTVVSVALGTVGGLGCLIAFYVTTMIRCYNRLSIFIAFFALAGLFLLLQRLAGRFAQRPWSKAVYAAGLIGLLALGLFDQTSPSFIPSYTAVRKEFDSDADFGRRMEAVLPAGSMVFQMPYFPFPEHVPVQQLGDYELLRPFLHTRTLRWSYGAVKGREAGRWSADLADQPLPRVVEALAVADFRGVYLDRAGFADGGAEREAELSRLLGVEPLVSRNGRQTFFDLAPFVRSLHARIPDQEWEERKDKVLHPIELRWGGSFLGPEESPPEGAWRRCGAEGELHVVNPSRSPRRVVLTMQCSGLWDQKAPSRLVVNGGGERRALSLTAERQPLEIALTAPPGDLVLHFACDGRGLRTDEGTVVFRLWNFKYRIEE